MTTEHPYAEILRGIADGKKIEWMEQDGRWHFMPSENVLREIADEAYGGRFRVKPEPVKARYRVAEMITSDGCHIAVAASDDDYAEHVQSRPHFRRWLTDWVEYEVSE